MPRTSSASFSASWRSPNVSSRAAQTALSPPLHAQEARDLPVRKIGHASEGQALGSVEASNDAVAYDRMRGPSARFASLGMTARHYDQVIKRSSCVCMRCGWIGTTRTLKPYVPLSDVGTRP